MRARNWKISQADLVDVICINRYYGWYIDIGYPETVKGSWIFDVKNWQENFGKPVVVTEYGAESLPGLNQVLTINLIHRPIFRIVRWNLNEVFSYPYFIYHNPYFKYNEFCLNISDSSMEFIESGWK